MLIIPLVPTSIIAGLLKLENTRELKVLGLRTITLFLSTAVVASILGLVIGSLFKVGAGVATAGLAARESQQITDVIARFRDFIPSNPVAAAAETKIIPLVVFSLFIGTAAVIESGKKQGTHRTVQSPDRFLCQSSYPPDQDHHRPDTLRCTGAHGLLDVQHGDGSPCGSGSLCPGHCPLPAPSRSLLYMAVF